MLVLEICLCGWEWERSRGGSRREPRQARGGEGCCRDRGVTWKCRRRRCELMAFTSYLMTLLQLPHRNFYLKKNQTKIVWNTKSSAVRNSCFMLPLIIHSFASVRRSRNTPYCLKPWFNVLRGTRERTLSCMEIGLSEFSEDFVFLFKVFNILWLLPNPEIHAITSSSCALSYLF